MQILSSILSGDSGIEKLRDKTPIYDLFTKISLGVMLIIIVGRAISLVPPPIETTLRLTGGRNGRRLSPGIDCSAPRAYFLLI